jgi:hypothetical protein
MGQVLWRCGVCTDDRRTSPDVTGSTIALERSAGSGIERRFMLRVRLS